MLQRLVQRVIIVLLERNSITSIHALLEHSMLLKVLQATVDVLYVRKDTIAKIEVWNKRLESATKVMCVPKGKFARIRLIINVKKVNIAIKKDAEKMQIVQSNVKLVISTT